MKILSLALLPAAFALTSCSSLDNPFSGVNLFGTGRDARVYNAQTGEFEWPKEQPSGVRAGRPPARKSAVAAAPERTGDGRYFDAVKNQWMDAPQERAAPARSKTRPPTPTAAAGPALVMPAATPSPPAERASGVYNPSTGRIEWKPYDPAAPAPPARRAPQKKSWWWPF